MVTFATTMRRTRNIWMIMLLMPVMMMAQEVIVLKQRKFPKTVSAGNYSGITWLGGSRYALPAFI